jgi:hypothetical protein
MVYAAQEYRGRCFLSLSLNDGQVGFTVDVLDAPPPLDDIQDPISLQRTLFDVDVLDAPPPPDDTLLPFLGVEAPGSLG